MKQNIWKKIANCYWINKQKLSYPLHFRNQYHRNHQYHILQKRNVLENIIIATLEGNNFVQRKNV